MAKVFRRTHYGRRKEVDKYWWIRYRDADGRDRKERVSPSKRQAELVLATRLAALAEGKKLPSKRDGSRLFADFAVEYLEVHGPKLRWVRTVRSSIRQWEEHLGPRCRLRDIDVRKIEAFRSRRLDRGLKPATVNKRVGVLHRMLNVAIDWGILEENPARRVRALRENNARLRFLTKQEAERLVEACRRSRNGLLEPLVLLALNTGARRGELLALRWQDVNFDADTLSFVETKNGERRDLPLNSAALSMLQRLHRRRGLGEHVFSVKGKSMGAFRSAWATAVKRAALQDFRFHDLRHAYASWAAQAGVDVRRLQRLLGHKTLAMTMRYSHLAPRDLREAVEMVAFEGTELRLVESSE